jgi:hypothetical protein
MKYKTQGMFSGLEETRMVRMYIRRMLSTTGRIVMLGLVLLLAEQWVSVDILDAAGPRKKTAAATPDSADASSKRILSITVDTASASGETVHIDLSGNFPPTTQVIEGDEPRIICDFQDVRMVKTIQRAISVNGKFILQIRTGIHPPPDAKSRIVLDLVPKHDYEVEQLFYEKDNRYTMIIREKS